jgi:hypothetical protein
MSSILRINTATFENPVNAFDSNDEDTSEGASRTNNLIAVDEDDAVLQINHEPPPLGHGKPDDDEDEGYCLLIDGNAAWQDSWDVLHMLIIGYIFLELPLRLGFRWTVEAEGEPVPSELYMTRATDLIIDLAMLVDMISRFFTTYTWHDFYGEEFVVRNHRKIVNHYIRGEFGVDFISCMPFDTIVRLMRIGDSTYGPGWVADHVRVMRLARASRLVKLIALFSDKMVKVSEAVPGLGWLKDWTSMIITILIMIAWNHFICCFLAWAGSPLHDDPHCVSDGIGYYVKPGSCDTEQGCDTDCVPDDNPGDSVDCDYLMPCGWVTRTNQKDIQSKAFLDAYITTYYWAFTIITTIGFGDISGSSTRERFLMVAAMMVGALSFGVIIGRVGAMVQSRSMGRIAYDARFRELQEYMQYRATSQRLRTKVFSYLTTKFPNRTIFDESKILAGLPDKLRVELQIENYYNAVAAVPFLPTNDIHIRTAICSRLIPMTFMQGEHIIHEGALGREMYLIEHGKVVFVHEYQVDDQVLSAPCPTWASDVGEVRKRDTDMSPRGLAAAIGLSTRDVRFDVLVPASCNRLVACAACVLCHLRVWQFAFCDLTQLHLHAGFNLLLVQVNAATPWRTSAHTLFKVRRSSFWNLCKPIFSNRFASAGHSILAAIAIRLIMRLACLIIH